MNLMIYDCETTGLDGDIIEISFKYFYKSSKAKYRTFTMRPDKPVLPASTVVHGYTQEDVNQFNDPKKESVEIYKFLTENSKTSKGSNTMTFAAYNSGFDATKLDELFKRYLGKTFQPECDLDILRFAKKLIPFEKIGGYKLDAVFYYFFPDEFEWLKENRAMHDAKTDCDIADSVLSNLRSMLTDQMETTISLPDLCKWVFDPMDVSDQEWKFGKLKGIKIGDTWDKDPGYAEWCLTSSFSENPQNKDIVYTLETKK